MIGRVGVGVGRGADRGADRDPPGQRRAVSRRGRGGRRDRRPGERGHRRSGAADPGAGVAALAVLAVGVALLGPLVLSPSPARAQSARDLPAETDADLLWRLKPGIKGRDDRLTVEATTWPWAAVGRVNRHDGIYCTGSLIGPAQVLTAAHCLWNRRTGAWMPASGLTFVAGYQRGTWLAASPVVAVRPSPGFHPQATASGADPVADWAILTLADPLGEEVGWFGLWGPHPDPETGPDAGPETGPGTTSEDTTPPPDARSAALPIPLGASVTQVGYSSDRRHVLTATLGCRLLARRDPGGLVLHDCDAISGDSGSPLLIWGMEGPRIVALHVATARTRSGQALGVAVPASQSDEPGRPPHAGRPDVDQALAGLLAAALGYDGAADLHRRLADPAAPADRFDRRDLARLLAGALPPVTAPEAEPDAPPTGDADPMPPRLPQAVMPDEPFADHDSPPPPGPPDRR